MRRILWIVAALALASPAGAAPSARTKREAKRRFDKAETEYKLGRFSEALSLYQQAYELLPEPAFLFNMGQCHRNLGDLERALYFFRGFSGETDDPRARARVERLIEEIEAKQEEQRREEEERARRSAATATEARALPQIRTATAVAAAAPPPPEAEPGLPVWPFIVAAVVAVVGGGVAIALVATRGSGPAEDGFFVDWRDRR
jgi:tetratricopeptide (TPR) repeat protein